MSSRRTLRVVAVIVGVLVAGFLVHASFTTIPVVISGVQVDLAGFNNSAGGVTVDPVFVAPTERQGAIPALPFDVAGGENLTVIWQVYIGTSAPGTVFNVTEVSVGMPFEFTSTVPGMVWHELPQKSAVEEDITVLAPTAPGNYDVIVTLTMSP